MKRITGFVLDKNGMPLKDATVMLKDKRFSDIVTATADKNGYYCIETDEGIYPYMLAVRDYAEAFLEHWVGNISLYEDQEINFTVDALEVYGLTCFKIRGGAAALSIYFRPMSLEKFKTGTTDICPDLTTDSITVKINGETVDIGTYNEVTEFCPINDTVLNMKGYFLMTTLPKSALKDKDNFLEVRIEDINTKAIGCAGLFFDKDL